MQRTGWSYVQSPSAIPFIDATIGRCFDGIVERFPEREALVVCHQNIRWSYRDLQRRVDAVAAGLLRAGLLPGERIGIWSQNNAEWVLAQLATAKAGLILVNINPAYRLTELEYALNKVDCRALIASPCFKSSDYLAMLQQLLPELAGCAPGELHAQRFPGLRLVIRLGDERTPGMLNFSELLRDASAAELAALRELDGRLQFDDPVNIQFTSGTTGSPKGATLSHHNILNNAYFTGLRMNFSERDRLCITLPLYHCFGMVLGNLTCITHGATMVLPSESFDAGAVLRAVQSERCTALHGVPTMFIGMLEHPDFAQTDLSTLRTGIVGGAACPIEVMKRIIADLHMSEAIIAFGMTETSPTTCTTAPTDSLERRVSSCGQVLPHLELKIVDAEGRIVPRGEPGEILIRGYAVMLGYWGDAARTAETIDAARWLRTGDIGVLDGDDYGRIVGRSKDMLIRGGENIYPREIEEFLFRHPHIEQAAVFGVPDSKYGEEVAVWIKLRAETRLSADELREFCRDQIAHYKIPRHVRFVDEFPMTVTGKIQKFVMRERMIAEFEAGSSVSPG